MKFKCTTHLKCRTHSFLPHSHHESILFSSLTLPLSFRVSGLFYFYLLLFLLVLHFLSLSLSTFVCDPHSTKKRPKERNERQMRKKVPANTKKEKEMKKKEKKKEETKSFLASVSIVTRHFQLFSCLLAVSVVKLKSDDPSILFLSIIGHMLSLVLLSFVYLVSSPSPLSYTRSQVNLSHLHPIRLSI